MENSELRTIQSTLEAICFNNLRAEKDEDIRYIPDPDCGTWVSEWKAAKSLFVKAFGSKLIYEVPLEDQHLTLSGPERHDLFLQCMRELRTGFFPIDAQFLLSYNEHTFFENRVDKLPSTHAEKYSIKLNQKLTTAIGRIITNPPDLRRAQDIISKYIQMNKVESSGVSLYLSVHPYDFMSMSENRCNWSSCHSLDGDYRAGDVNYMLDSVTVVAYTARRNFNSHLDYFPEDIKWNSKRWRMLLFANENVIYGGRNYPSPSSGLTELAMQTLAELLTTAFDRQEPYTEVLYLEHSYSSDAVNPLRGTMINNGILDTDCSISNEIFRYSDYYLGYKDLIEQSDNIPVCYGPWLSEYIDFLRKISPYAQEGCYIPVQIPMGPMIIDIGEAADDPFYSCYILDTADSLISDPGDSALSDEEENNYFPEEDYEEPDEDLRDNTNYLALD